MRILTEQEQQQIDQFNKCYKAGDVIQILGYDGKVFTVKVTYGAKEIYGIPVVLNDQEFGSHELKRMQSKYQNGTEI